MKQLSILFRGTLGFPFPVSGAFALCLLLLASCGGDDSSDEGYAAIESASFTFDETTPANNAVRVIANTGWQVFWTPESAAVRVEPASGSGNGVFYVWDMPKGEVKVRSCEIGRPLCEQMKVPLRGYIVPSPLYRHRLQNYDPHR